MKKEMRLQSQEILDKTNHRMVEDAYFTTQKKLDSTHDLHQRPEIPLIQYKKHQTKKKNDNSLEHMKTEQDTR